MNTLEKNIKNNKNDDNSYEIIKKLNSRQILLMESLKKFFDIPQNLENWLPIVQGKSDISLRVIDWFVTNYSKKNNTIINFDKGMEKKDVNVYLDYKAQLKSYSKKLFDPFCRRERIIFLYDNDEEQITTVGQLNFFRWAIENKIVDYIKTNLKNIEDDMNNSIRNLYKKNSNGERRKRHELSISATKMVNKHSVKIVVDFN
jgi:hypothetical protein